MNYLLFFILCYTMASIIVEQKIFAEAREWLKICAENNDSFLLKKLCQLVNCTFCTGFWCGLFLTLTGFNIFNIGILDPFYGALTGAFSGYSGHLVFLWIENKLLENKIENF